MNIHIVKNSHGLHEKTFNNGCVLQSVESDSEYENIKQVRYFLYDLEKNESVEIEPTVKKYNLITVKDIKFNSEYVYYTNISKGKDGADLVCIRLYRYDIIEKKSIVVYEYEEQLDKFNDYMRTKIFAINEYYLFIQNEFLRANLTEEYVDYFEYELYMYSINEGKKYKITDENLNRYGIIEFEPLTSNICVLKSGFSLLKDNRYKILKKDEAAMESVSFVNIGQMVSDILLGQPNVVMDTIENVYYTSTIPYMRVDNGYVIYSKVKLDDNLEEEIVFYNFAKKEAVMCINGSMSDEKKTAEACIMGNKPYIILEKAKGYELIDILEKKNMVILDNNNKIEYIKDNIVVASVSAKGFLGREKTYIMVYKLPSMKLLHREKGTFASCAMDKNEQLYIMTKTDSK